MQEVWQVNVMQVLDYDTSNVVGMQSKPMIEGVDPLTEGRTTYGEDLKSASTRGKTVEKVESSVKADFSLPASKSPNGSRAAQARVAAGRKE